MHQSPSQLSTTVVATARRMQGSWAVASSSSASICLSARGQWPLLQRICSTVSDTLISSASFSFYTNHLSCGAIRAMRSGECGVLPCHDDITTSRWTAITVSRVILAYPLCAEVPSPVDCVRMSAQGPPVCLISPWGTLAVEHVACLARQEVLVPEVALPELYIVMRARVDRFARVQDDDVVLDPSAVVDADLLEDLAVSIDGADVRVNLSAIHVLAWFYWYRYTCLPSGQDVPDLQRARSFFSIIRRRRLSNSSIANLH